MNKPHAHRVGASAIRFRFFKSTLCFVCSHLGRRSIHPSLLLPIMHLAIHLSSQPANQPFVHALYTIPQTGQTSAYTNTQSDVCMNMLVKCHSGAPVGSCCTQRKFPPYFGHTVLDGHTLLAPCGPSAAARIIGAASRPHHMDWRLELSHVMFMYLCLRIICMCVCVYLYVYVYVMYASMYVCMYVCMYV